VSAREVKRDHVTAIATTATLVSGSMFSALPGCVPGDLAKRTARQEHAREVAGVPQKGQPGAEGKHTAVS
jgi:hypothetical protein